VEQLNENLVQRTKELQVCNNKIDTLNKRIQELENEYLAAEAKIMDISNKNHELTKLLQKMKDSLGKKEQV